MSESGETGNGSLMSKILLKYLTNCHCLLLLNSQMVPSLCVEYLQYGMNVFCCGQRFLDFLPAVCFVVLVIRLGPVPASKYGERIVVVVGVVCFVWAAVASSPYWPAL